MLILAWLYPQLNRQENLRGAQIASWAGDWEGTLVAACGMKGLERKDLNFFSTHTMLVRAMMAAESKQSRAGMSAVAKAFTELGRHEVAAMVLRRIRTDWPDETKYSVRSHSGNCRVPALGDG